MPFPKWVEDKLAGITASVNDGQLSVIQAKDKDGGEHYVLIAPTGDGNCVPFAILREDLVDTLVPPHGQVEQLRNMVPSAGQLLTALMQTAIPRSQPSPFDLNIESGSKKTLVN